ncbi:MAG: undecaprenyldiphospho-muramoylpentapeptide beta-N-acetylglucosaminyltransferase [Rhodothermales bacterium]|nr:undecaprenyldiphospho-muramoylpentapeptide beta-N-acetylglucosaminyltransferase [Rhodothermales bacterium]
MHQPPRILFAGGGTGGHVYPAIAIADAVRELEPKAVIAFAGTTRGLEWKAVPAAGYEIHEITVSGFKRSFSTENLSFPFKLLKGMKQSFELVSGFRPMVGVGTGGYVSGPVMRAATLKQCPVVIQEQNAFPGKTNLLLSRHASEIHIAFPEARDRFKGRECKLSGNPIRATLATADRNDGLEHFGIEDGKMVVFMFGGSGGSGAMNEIMLSKIDQILSREEIVMIWQTGDRYYDSIASQVQQHPRLKLLKYVDRMDLAYSVTDLAVCRSGAITCSELALTGTPAVLVPSPNVAEDHQTYNARSLSDAGAAVLVAESDLSEQLVDLIHGMIADSVKRLAMSKRATERAYPKAATTIAESVLAVAAQNAGGQHAQA